METIKEEKKADLEQLLNMLIQRGWKPFGNEKVYKIKVCKIKLLRPEKEIIRIELSKGRGETKGYTTVRTICSKESGLWQFVCENGLVEMYEGFYWQNIFPLDSIEYDYTDYQYWLLESSLKDENELEDFLLSNIKVDE